MMTYQEDKIQLDFNKITRDEDSFHGATTVFHDVVIASELVQPYSDGNAYKSRDELEAYAWTAEGRHVTLGAHPDTAIISDRSQVHGRTVNVRYSKSLTDPVTKRPNRAGVVADLVIYDSKAPKELLEAMKNGVKRDVSIGFFYQKDPTPGEYNGLTYDYVQRNMFHDHLAAAIDQGRCPSPYCGLGADELKTLVADPFAGFASFAECERKIREENPSLSDEAVAKICGSLKAKHEDSLMEEKPLVKAARILRTLLEEEIEALRGERDALKIDEKPLEWWKNINWKTPEYVTIFDHLDEQVRQAITDEGLCPKCDEEPDKECEEGYEKDPETGECVPVEEEEDVKLTLPKDPESHKKPKAQKGGDEKKASFEELMSRGDKILREVKYESK